MNIQQAIDLAIKHHTAGDLDRAKAIYQQVLQAQPEQPDALHLLGLIAHQNGNNDRAVELIEKALALKPDYAEACNNLGSALHGLNKLNEAVEQYREAIALLPTFSKAHFNLGNALKDQGHLEEAATNYNKALSINPDYAKALNNLGTTLKELNKLDEAAARFRQALALTPGDAKTHFNLGATLQDQGQVEGALKQYDLALSLQPEYIGWKFRKALTLPTIPQSNEDIHSHRKTLAKAVQALRMQRPRITDPLGEVGITNFLLAYHHLDNRPLMEAIAALYLAACPDLAYQAEQCCALKHQTKPRLRIGFLSSYFHAHTIGKLTRGLIENLSRERFEVVVFQVPGKRDAITKSIESTADRLVPLHKNLDKDRPVIAEQELDILFYPDIGMHPYTYFLAFARLAPVQVVCWGHPDTTGIPNMDYFLSSELIESFDSAQQYTEKMVPLSLLPTCYDHPHPPQKSYSRNVFGLPETGALYICPQTLFKFHPDFDKILCDLLNRDPDGWLVLIDDGNGGHWNRLLSERLALSYPDIASRLVFVKRLPADAFLGLLMIADALLDIPSFSGGNSTLEAFAMSAPIVTWPGDFMRSRVTAGCYRQMGLDELIASNAEDYIALTLKLAHDKGFKTRMQADIQTNAHKLFARTDAVREIEAFFLRAYEASQQAPA